MFFLKNRTRTIVACLILLIFFCYGSFVLRGGIITQESSTLPKALIGASDFELGQYYFNHGDNADGTYDLDIAQSYFEKAIEADERQNKLLWHQSGRIDFIQGDFDTALYKSRKQIEYFGDEVPNVYYLIGLTYGYKAKQTGNSEDWQKAEEGFIKSLEYFDYAPWPYVDLAWVYFSQGKFIEMKSLLEKAFLADSNNPWLFNMYGLALLNTGDKALAHEYFLFAKEQALLVTPAEWGKSYPGNDPELWDDGVLEFNTLIDANIVLSQ